MKSFISVFLFTAAVWAQSAVPSITAAAPAPKELAPDTVLATFGNGEKLTFGELKSFMSVLPPQMQQNALHDRREFVEQFALMHRLAEMAEQEKLDQRSPIKESLAFNRMFTLMNAKLHEEMNSVSVPATETRAYYDRIKDRFAQVKVKAIYVSFTANPPKDPQAGAKKVLTEAEAKAKIDKLRAEIVAGADFGKLAKANSDDETSAAKDGDFGTIRRSDKLPDAVREAIFSLKKGELSQPVKQPNGFYLFLAEDIGIQPYSEVEQQVLTELKKERFNAWMEQTKRALNIKFENEEFFAGTPAKTASK
jgi:peptidyl-prolyl cis-trans isomerase C